MPLMVLMLATASGCMPKDSARAKCVDGLLRSSAELEHGIAVFNDNDGTIGQRANGLTAQYRLLSHGELSAASLSKPITASLVREHVENATWSLDSRLADLLPTVTLDAAHAEIRLRQLLQHSAGFDRHISGDPLWRSDGVSAPYPDCASAANLILKAPLDYAPGQQAAYSNAGYCVLGRLLLMHAEELSATDLAMLRAPLGAAGGWTSTPVQLHTRLFKTLPLRHIDPEVALADGSHYDFGWRHRPSSDGRPYWTHFGRLPGRITIAVSDGKDNLLVAYFDGDPVDVDKTSELLAKTAWQCIDSSD